MTARNILMAAAGTSGEDKNYIEDVFSTHLYDNMQQPAPRSIVNNLPLATTSQWSLIKYGGDAAAGVNTYGRSVTADSAGNIYMTGTGVGDIYFVAKFNSSGSLLWQKSGVNVSGYVALSGKGIQVDGSGNVYTAGSALISGVSVGFIDKYNSSGVLQWSKRFTSGALATFNGLSLSTDGSMIYTVGIGVPSSKYETLIAAYNASGALVWQRRLNSSATDFTLGYGISCDSAGFVYVSGSVSPKTFIAKYNSSGVLQWQRELSAGVSHSSTACVARGSDGVYVTGNANPSDGNHIYLAYYNSSGVIQWERRISEQIRNSNGSAGVTVDANGNAYISGTQTLGIPGLSNTRIYAFTAKYDVNGQLLNKRSFLHSYVQSDSSGTTDGGGIFVDGTGNVYSTGRAENGANLVYYAFVLKQSASLDSSGTVNFVGDSGATLSPSTAVSTTVTPASSNGTLTDLAGGATVADSGLTLTTPTTTSTVFTKNAVSSSKKGIVWIKSRLASSHTIFQNEGFYLSSETTAALTSDPNSLISFNSDGFNLGGSNSISQQSHQYAAWTFCKQPKFFDVVTYTGNGATFEFVAHNLQSSPGAIFIKATSTTGDWFAWCRTSPTDGSYLKLNSTEAQVNTGNAGGLSYAFPVGTSLGGVNTNASGVTYVAYLFASDAGGFGESGSDNVISCGSYTSTGGQVGPAIYLGWEPQWVMIKRITGGTGNWVIIDNIRGNRAKDTVLSWDSDGSLVADSVLHTNSSASEELNGLITPTATGFKIVSRTAHQDVTAASSKYIYIAIRKGPMKTPTNATSVFMPIATSAGSETKISTGFPVDLQIFNQRNNTSFNYKNAVYDRMRGVRTRRFAGSPQNGGPQLNTTTNVGEDITLGSTTRWDNTGYHQHPVNSGVPTIYWNFRRAPKFFDIVNGALNNNSTHYHSLTVVPELWIHKNRTSGSNYSWYVGGSVLGSATNDYLRLEQTSAKVTGTNIWSTPTNTTWGIGSGFPIFLSGDAVVYLFASCPGVSKVGSFTGTSATQVINCGFTAGARFVLIKTTSGTGDWYVWDSARGIVAGNDPYLLLNSTAAEVTTTDWVDTAATGFELTGGANPANIAGATYIYLAIA